MQCTYAIMKNVPKSSKWLCGNSWATHALGHMIWSHCFYDYIILGPSPTLLRQCLGTVCVINTVSLISFLVPKSPQRFYGNS